VLYELAFEFKAVARGGVARYPPGNMPACSLILLPSSPIEPPIATEPDARETIFFAAVY
jgi:hypothetical protein